MATIEPMRSPPPEYSAINEHKPVPQDLKSGVPSLQNGNSNNHTERSEDKSQVERQKSESLSPAPLPKSDSDDEDAVEVKLEDDKVKVEDNKRKYDEEEKKLKSLEGPPLERLQDDWQVAYVWAFIVKFNQKERIRGLESAEDFERSLIEPVAVRPDDVLEGILIQFLKNLRPALRNLSYVTLFSSTQYHPKVARQAELIKRAETIQNSLSNYISDQLLNSTEFTVWDRAWAANEEVRGGCCNSAEDRMELGRLRYFGEPLNERVAKNPIKKQIEKGGGIFEMDWRDRVKMLRQLVDWQLVHADVIRAVINNEAKIPPTKKEKEIKALPVTDPEIVKVEPLGHDRDKTRIWSFDDSPRIYKSGNPFKRPCPLVPITTTRAELESLTATYAEHGAKEIVKPDGKGPKGKLTAAQSSQYKKAMKGKEDEVKLAEKLRELIPLIEKEEARVQRAKKRVEAAANLANMAEWRSTRTRRTTRKIDYTYGAEAEEDVDSDAPTTSKRRRGTPEYANGLDDRGRAIIPGERRSARMSAKDEYAAEDQEEEDSYSDEGDASMPTNGDGIVDDHENGNDDDDFNGDHGQSANGASSPPISSESGMEVE